MSKTLKPEWQYVEHPAIDEIREGLLGWMKKYPDRLDVMVPAKSRAGRDVIFCKVTDNNVADGDKQIVFVTCTHVGMELNAATSCLHFLKWLIGDSELARETRLKQIVIVMPAGAPDTYTGVRGPDKEQGEGNPHAEYWSWSGTLQPERNPEAVALIDMMKRYLPDVHVDLHGGPYKNFYMAESTGIAWFSGLSRAYVPQIIWQMNQAADAMGFGVSNTNGEDAAGMVRATAPIEVKYILPEFSDEDLDKLSGDFAAQHYFMRASNINTCVYSYHNYHALSCTMEIGFEQSALVRLQKLMEIGNSKWCSEYYTGYPVNHFGNGLLVALAGWGKTVAERRKSRLELWDKFNQFCFGYGTPPYRGELIAVCATTPKGAEKYYGINASKINDQKDEAERQAPSGYVESLEKLMQRLESEARFDSTSIKTFIKDSPVNEYFCFGANGGFSEHSHNIENGLGLRLHIPDNKAKIKQVLLDGHQLDKSETSGYTSWAGSGTTVQVNIPPGNVQDFHIVLCRYEESSIYRCGFSKEDWEISSC